MRLDLGEYRRIRKKLNSVEDLDKLQYPRGMLHSILQQKIIWNVKRKYGYFKKKVDLLVRHWKKNKRMPGWLSLTPVMNVRLLLQGMGYSRKEIVRVLSNPEYCEDEEMREVIWKAVITDFVYSPLAVRLQWSKGKLGERIIEEHLKKIGIDYRTERDLRKSSSVIKTPDFVFNECVDLCGANVKWLESKVMFGDFIVHRYFEKKQLSVYKDTFGDGLVVYLVGCLSNIDALDGSFLSSKLLSNLLKMEIYFGSEADLCNDDWVIVKYRGNPLSTVGEVVESFSSGKVLINNCNNYVKEILKNLGFRIVCLNS